MLHNVRSGENQRSNKTQLSFYRSWLRPYRMALMSLVAVLYMSIAFVLATLHPSHANEEPASHVLNQVNGQRHMLNVDEQTLNAPLQSNDRLVWAQLLHRHGDRTPIHALPKLDPSTGPWLRWPLPPGSLTSTGWAQHQAVGRAIKQRYFQSDANDQSNNHSLNLSTDYQPRSVYVRSTDVERCVQSVLALLSSIYQTKINPNSHLSIDESNSHTIPHPPLTIVPIELDMLLQPSDKCPSALLSYMHSFKQSDDAITKYDPTLRALLDEHAGTFNPDHNSIAYDVLMTADWLLCEAAHNVSTNAQLTANFNRLTKLSRFASYNRYTQPSFVDPRGSAGDVLLRDLLRSAYLKLTGDKSREDEKLRIYSSHDTTVLSLLSSLKVIAAMDESWIDPSNTNAVNHPSFNWLLPDYATVLSTELWIDGASSRPFIQFKIGYPRLKSGSALADSDNSEDWEFVDEVLNIRCPKDDLSTRSQMEHAVMQSRCDFASFTRYVLIMTNASFDELSPPSADQLPTSQTSFADLMGILKTVDPLPLDRYHENDGCCVRPDDYESRCPYDRPFHSQHQYCKYFRRLCPLQACDAGQQINFANMNCVANSQAHRSGFSSETLEAALIVTFGLLLISLAVIGLMYSRTGTSAKYSSIHDTFDHHPDERIGTQMARAVKHVKRKARHARERDSKEKVRLETSEDDDDEYDGHTQQ